MIFRWFVKLIMQTFFSFEDALCFDNSASFYKHLGSWWLYPYLPGTICPAIFDTVNTSYFFCDEPDGEDPGGVQEGFEAVVLHPEQAGSSEATGQEAHNGGIKPAARKF